MAYHSQGSTLALLHSSPLDPLTPLDMLLSSPPNSGSASTSTSASDSTPDSESVAIASTACSFTVFQSITFWYHHRRDTLAPVPLRSPLTEVQNWSRRNVLRDRVLPPCDGFPDLCKPCLSHGLPQRGIVPFPIPPSPRLSPRDSARDPVHDTVQRPLDPCGQYPRLRQE